MSNTENEHKYGMRGTHCARCDKPLERSGSIWCDKCFVEIRMQERKLDCDRIADRVVEILRPLLRGDPMLPSVPFFPASTADDFDVEG